MTILSPDHRISLRYDLRSAKTFRQCLTAWVSLCHQAWADLTDAQLVRIECFRQLLDSTDDETFTPVHIAQKWTAGFCALFRTSNDSAGGLAGGFVVAVDVAFKSNIVRLTASDVRAAIELTVRVDADGFLDPTNVFGLDRDLRVRGARGVLAELTSLFRADGSWLLPNYEGSEHWITVDYAEAVRSSDRDV